MKTWALQDAKAQFSELVQLCRESGPQLVTRHGQDAVVVVSAAMYKTLTRNEQSLGNFLRSAPRVDLDLVRSNDEVRDIEL